VKLSLFSSLLFNVFCMSYLQDSWPAPHHRLYWKKRKRMFGCC
jgi:hypothetical protein